VDVAREADLIEEVGRHWGFDRIPATYPPARVPARPMVAAIARDRMLRRVLCGAGLQEACTFTFIEREAALPFAGSEDRLVEIANPLSEKFAALRPSLLPGLVDALIYSRRRETADVRLFEAGSAFTPEGEQSRVAWVMAGPRQEHWSGSAGDVDTFDAIGIAELIGEAFGTRLSARPTEAYPWLVRGRAAEIVTGGADGAVVIGHAGELVPDLAARRGLGQRIALVVGEIDTRALEAAAPARTGSRVDPLPRFPSIVRDLAIVVSDRLPAADLRGTIRSSAPPTLVAIQEFDRYQGAGMPQGMVSLAIRLTFRDRDRTLTDADVQKATDAIVAALAERHGATLRS
jgi:phenylalanyl-tRNA synthetase beta chain